LHDNQSTITCVYLKLVRHGRILKPTEPLNQHARGTNADQRL